MGLTVWVGVGAEWEGRANFTLSSLVRARLVEALISSGSEQQLQTVRADPVVSTYVSGQPQS